MKKAGPHACSVACGQPTGRLTTSVCSSMVEKGIMVGAAKEAGVGAHDGAAAHKQGVEVEDALRPK